MNNLELSNLEWLDGEGLEDYKKAYKEGRIYGLVAYPINPIYGKDYLPHDKAFDANNLLTLEQCQAYADTLDANTDVIQAYNCVDRCYNNDIKIGG